MRWNMRRGTFWLIGILLVSSVLVGCDGECGNGVCEPLGWESCGSCPEDCCDVLPDTVHHDVLPDTVHHSLCGNDVIDAGEECEAEADCPGLNNHCNRETCQCVTCEEMPLDFPGACGTDEECVEEYGDDYFCNQAACNCFTCPDDSDGCRSSADCPAGLHCNTALCECVPCAELGLDFPGACGTDEECVEEFGDGYFCNQYTCNCFSCPEGSDGCWDDAFCQELLGDPSATCFTPTCTCVVPGCGDGYCDVESENTDLCPEDCPCVDDGECSPGEGEVCYDCGELASACGAPCETSEDCREGLSCFNAVCWDDCICEGRCGEQPDEGGPSCRQCRSDSG